MKTERHGKGNRALAQSRVQVGAVRNHRSVGDAGSSDVLNSCRKTGASFCDAPDNALMSVWKKKPLT